MQIKFLNFLFVIFDKNSPYCLEAYFWSSDAAFVSGRHFLSENWPLTSYSEIVTDYDVMSMTNLSRRFSDVHVTFLA